MMLPKLVKSFDKNIRIIQWNIRGAFVNGNHLDIMIAEYKPDVLCLQEASVVYAPKKPIVITGYKEYADDYCKTVTYIRETLIHGHYKRSYWILNGHDIETLPLPGNHEVKDILYGTNVVIKGQVAHYHIGNYYRSPNGNAPYEPAFSMVKDTFSGLVQSLKWKQQKVKHVVLGDFNLSNEAWGAPAGLTRNSEGDDMANFMVVNGFSSENDGHCTRRQLVGSTIQISWIDVTAQKGFHPRQLHLQTMDNSGGSDHLPIVLDLNEVAHLHDILGVRAKWMIPREYEGWDAIGRDFRTRWDAQKVILLEDINRSNWSNQEQADRIYDTFKQCMDNTMATFLTKRSPTTHWKPWITKEVKEAIVEYHVLEREFFNNNKGKRDAAGWKNFKWVRYKKNLLAKGRKKQWIKDKFSEVGLNGKEGWAIAAEVRDLSRGSRIIPDLVHQEDILKNVNDKAEAFNHHYHRFEDDVAVPLANYTKTKSGRIKYGSLVTRDELEEITNIGDTLADVVGDIDLDASG